MVAHKDYGSRIEGSRFYRAYCPGCDCPMRVTKNKLASFDQIWCGECAPHPVTTIGSSFSGLNSRDKDLDAYQPSWRYS